jgi:type IV fimbrial biogenesis protein FimT
MKAAKCAVGFTLIELLVVVAVLGVILTVATPNLAGMMVTSGLEAQSNAFLFAVHLTRHEAVKRNARMVLCKSAAGSSCDTSGGWEKGWIIFHDVNNNTAVDAGETIIQRKQALPASFLLRGNSPVSKYVSYTSTGVAKLSSGAFQAGTLTLCSLSSSGGEARQIVISITGRPRVEETTVASCA